MDILKTKMKSKIVYMGDGFSPGPASYLVAVMTYYGLNFIHVPSAKKPPGEIFNGETALFILSDYSSGKFSEVEMDKLCNCIKEGAGVVMIGGWSSYHGLSGNWDKTPLAKLLPVNISSMDDRKNCPQPVLIKKVAEHKIVDELPFEKPPTIGGYNEFSVKNNGQTILVGEMFSVSYDTGGAEFSSNGTFPLLVVSEDTGFRAACFATDAAPHWVGGLVDWGGHRITAEFDGGFVEVGDHYARFFHNLLQWCAAQ